MHFSVHFSLIIVHANFHLCNRRSVQQSAVYLCSKSGLTEFQATELHTFTYFKHSYLEGVKQYQSSTSTVFFLFVFLDIPKVTQMELHQSLKLYSEAGHKRCTQTSKVIPNHV